MDAERWQKIERLYHAALELAENERAGFLERKCGADEQLKKEVASLLAQVECTRGFLEAPAMEVAAKALAKSAADGESEQARFRAAGAGKLPATIGRYRIIGLLGEGGMGTVYEAEQEQPRRVVALKIIKAGFCTPEGLRRFEHETQALGRLQHPGIAQIYEAGSADTGFGAQPYFAMELVRGQPLLSHAEESRLNVRQRLALMVKICDAAHHAHQRGLIHRDLKPSNILVDETGQPKILDFGVVRVTGSEAEATRQTSTGQIVGTLTYMSPEQVVAEALDVRSDVYSLGVILYELLSGRRPFNVSHRQLHEAVRMIHEDDPTSLSAISRIYRGDIETIVGKALEKDKTRRYASAAALAADIRCYLDDEPIAARKPSTTYQVRKFARRNRALVGGAAAVFVVLAAGVVVSTSQAIRANRAGQAAVAERDRALTEKKRADDEAASATAISDFLQNDLLAQASARAQAGPGSKPDPDLRVRTALDRAAGSIEGRFSKQPLVEASIRRTIGMTYVQLGVYPEAERQIGRSVELRRRVLGELHADTLLSMRNLAAVYLRQSKYKDAAALYEKVLQGQVQSLGERNPEALETMLELAEAYVAEGKSVQAEPLLVKTVETRRRVLGEQHVDTLAAATELGVVYQNEGKLAQAETLLTSALEGRRRAQGEDHPDTLLAKSLLEALYQAEGKYDKAEPLLRSTLEVQRRELGEKHPETVFSMSSLAFLYDMQGKYAKAEPLYKRVLSLQQRTLGKEHQYTLNTMLNLCVLLKEEGKYSEAERLMDTTLEMERRVLGKEDSGTLITMNNLASLYVATGRYAKAEPMFANVLEIRRRKMGEEDAGTLRSWHNIEEVDQSLGRYGEAEPIAARTLSAQERLFGEDNPDTLESMVGLGVLYRREGRYDRAGALLVKALDRRRRTMGAEHPDTLSAMYELAALRRREGKYAEAAALFASVMKSRRRVLGATHPDTLDAITSLGEVQLEENNNADAESLAREALTCYDKSASDSWQKYRSRALLGASLAAQKKFEEAEPLLVSGYEGMSRRSALMPFEDQRTAEQAGRRLVELYESWGKAEKTAEWRKKIGESASK